MPSTKRILIISTTFFPDPGVSGIRVTQWCRHLPEHGWIPRVLCRHYGYEYEEEHLAEAVSPVVGVEYLDPPCEAGSAIRNRAPIGPTVRGSSIPLILWARRRILCSRQLASLFVPDPSILFWRRVRPRVLAKVHALKPDVVVTTSPPHSNHDIGMWLAEQTRTPWVADFRDPYFGDARFSPVGVGRCRTCSHWSYYRSILDRASLITHAIPSHTRWVQRFMGIDRRKLLTITNGFPPECQAIAEATSPKGGESRRVILVAGTILAEQRVRLARAVSQLIGEDFDLELRLLGKIPGNESELRAMLGDRLVTTGYVGHAAAISEISAASLLVSYLSPARSETHLLSLKLLEYLSTATPILCINPSGPDRLLLRRFPHVARLYEPLIRDIASTLRSLLERGSERTAAQVAEYRREFSWRNRTAQLVAGLDEVTQT